MISSTDTRVSPAEKSVGDLPDAPVDQTGTEFASWCEQANARQRAYSEARRKYRDENVSPILPPELHKPGRPR